VTAEDLPSGRQQAESIPSWVNILIMLVILAMVIVLRKGRHNPVNHTLPPHQRARPISLEWFDPLLEFLIAAAVLWPELSRYPSHVIAVIVGAVVGIPIGIARSRTMYVRAIPDIRYVVMRRSVLEFVLLGVLIVIKLGTDVFSIDNNSILAWAVTAGIGVVVGESITRSIAMTLRFRRDVKAAPAG